MKTKLVDSSASIRRPATAGLRPCALAARRPAELRIGGTAADFSGFTSFMSKRPSMGKDYRQHRNSWNPGARRFRMETG
ncbi:MAG: hypothetical protein LBS70_01470 [Candidatus Accumulibacter sp.]|jgi:hypothetical protein|nr:hypothetical protein [Accumulibacter sp.]